MTSEEKNRYSRHILLSQIGEAGQEKLKTAKVLVIGAGGLGCPVLQYLSAAGVGTIGIIDFDKIEESNLQRQILFSVDDIGKFKAESAKNRLEKLNPYINFSVYTYKLDTSNALSLFSQYDIIVDGTDNFSTRYLVNDACVICNKPLVYGAIYKFEGQVSVFNYKNGPTYRCLFPEPPKPGSVPNCSEVGVLGILPGIIGSYQANEALKIILEIGTPLSGKILLIDTLKTSQTILKINKKDIEYKNVIDNKSNFEQYDYDFFCGINSNTNEISASELKNILNQENLQIVDVREEWEKPKHNELKAINIPLNKLSDNIKLLDKTKKTVVYCQHGKRSLAAIEYLKKQNFKELLNLKDGIVTY